MRQVGQWQLDGVLGSGSFAVVWRARHAATGELAAVKEINVARLSAKLQSSLASEVSVLQRTSHQNLVGLLEIVKEEEKLYLVLEFCGGGDLGHFLRRYGPVPEATARHLLVQLAEGLKALRALSLVHRDLKPQNLLLSDGSHAPHLKIADFGFARNLQPQGLAETLCGSPLYMAPEILQLHKYDAKADLWSVGAILFELLTGKPPFNGANHLQLLQNIERGEGGRIPEQVAAVLSPACKHLVHHLLRRNPLERVSYEEFFAHPFLTQPVSSPSAPLLGQPQPPLPMASTATTAAPGARTAAVAPPPAQGAGAAPAATGRDDGPAMQAAGHAGSRASPGAATAGAALVGPGALGSSAVLRGHVHHQTPRVAYTGPLLGVHEATGISVHTAVMQKPTSPPPHFSSKQPGQPVELLQGGHRGELLPATPAHATSATAHTSPASVPTDLEYTDIDLGASIPAMQPQPHSHEAHLHLGHKHETTPGGLSVIEEVDDYVVVSTDPSPSSSQEDLQLQGAAARAGGPTASQVLGASWGGSRGRGAWDALSRMGPALLPPRLVASAASQLRSAASASSHVNQWVAPLGQLAAHVTQATQGARSPAGSAGSRAPASQEARGPSCAASLPAPASAAASVTANAAGGRAAPGGQLGAKPGARTAAAAATSAASAAPTAGRAGDAGSRSSPRACSASPSSVVGAEQLSQLVRVPEVSQPLDLVQRVLQVLVEHATKAWDAAVTEAEVACETKLEQHATASAGTAAAGPGVAGTPRRGELGHLGASGQATSRRAHSSQDPGTRSPGSHSVAGTAGSAVSTDGSGSESKLPSTPVAGSTTASAASKHQCAQPLQVQQQPQQKASEQALQQEVAAAMAQALGAAAPVLQRAAAEFLSLHLLCSELLRAALQSATESARTPSAGSAAGAAGGRTGQASLPATTSPAGVGMPAGMLLATHAKSLLGPMRERAPAVWAQLQPDQQLPDAAHLLYTAAATLSRMAAMDEMMGLFSASVQQYAKAADLLLLLLTSGSSSWGVVPQLCGPLAQQAHQLYVVLRIRQAACMADLNAQVLMPRQ